MGYPSNSSGSWRIVIALGIVFGTFLGIGILFMPESPRWLMHRGKQDEALESIARVRGASIDDPVVQVSSAASWGLLVV